MRPDGTTQAAQNNDGMARDYEYPDGTHEVVPPPGWSPLRATNQELQAYFIPPRPTDPAALAEWQQTWGHYNDQSSKAGASRCQTADRATLTNGSYESFNWAGGMAVNGTNNVNTFFDVNGKFKQTGFKPFCEGGGSVPSAYATWVGLGGKNSGRLLQIGSWPVAGTNVGSPIYVFWEALGNHVYVHAQYWGDVPIQPGDLVGSYVSFNASAGSWYATTTDITRNWYHGLGGTTIAGYPTSDFYDGTTAEYITESPTGGTLQGGYYSLRAPYLGNTLWTYADANAGQPIANFPSWNVHERNPFTHDLVQGSYFDGVHQWTNPWYNCY